MTVLVPITLYGWVIVAVILFAVLPPRRAVLVAFITGWLFLPQAAIEFSGLPDLTKVTAASMGALIGVLLFDAGRLTAFRFSWVDLPMAAWCLAPGAASIANDLGMHDALSGLLREIFTWGIPYFIGRLYFTDLASLRELAIGVFLGGLVYVPLCLWEIRMSPQLHNIVYGFHPTHFMMTVRFGGYRPMVFMQHGLMVGMWMTSTTLAGVWLWRTGALQKVGSLPMWALVGGLGATTVICKSMGALSLLALGLALLIVNRYLRSSLVLATVLLIAPAYMFVRVQGLWDGQELIDLAASIDEERAESLAGRLRDENLLIERASERPILGWGGWGRWRVKDEYTGQDLTASDGMWVIVRGETGGVGLVCNTLIVLLPFLLLLRRVPARHWSMPTFAGPAILAMLLLLWSIDNLFNAMHNPVYILAAGGLSGFYLAWPRQQWAMRRAQQQQMAMMEQHQMRLIQEAKRRQRLGQQAPQT
jgi:hypothetical protein